MLRDVVTRDNTASDVWADTAYRSQANEAWLKSMVLPIPHDCEKYRWRNLAERLFSKLKNQHRVATHYDKTPESYLGFVALASVTLWLPFVHAA